VNAASVVGRAERKLCPLDHTVFLFFLFTPCLWPVLIYNSHVFVVQSLAQQGDIETVKALLSGGNPAPVDSRDSVGQTALWGAAFVGDAAMCDLLLGAGACVDGVNGEGVTPLLVAAQEGHLEVCKTLVREGAGVDVADERGATPLFMAAGQGQEEVVRVLVEAGVDATDGAALFIGSQQGMVGVCKVLVEEGGVDVDVVVNGVTPLFVAAARGHGEVCR